MEKSTKKNLIILSALLVIGGVVAYIVIKKPFAKKNTDENDTYTPPVGEETTTTTPAPKDDLQEPSVAPVTTQADPRVKSFADVKKFFGTTATDYGSYISKSLTINKKLHNIQFASNGVYSVQVHELTAPESTKKWRRVAKGTYTNGGLKLHVKTGKNAGQYIAKQDPISAVQKSLT